MAYLDNNMKRVPSGFSKLLYLNWPIIILICAITFVGFLMLYSVAGGSMMPWAEPQIKRFLVGMLVLLFIATVSYTHLTLPTKA